MLNNIVFLVFKNNYRYFALGNFGRTRKYAKLTIISLGGKFRSFLGIILYYFKIGKFISIDGNPYFKDKEISINLWLTGTTLKILKEFRAYENNFVNMNNPIIKDERNVFQIYPIINKKKNYYKKPKIIFMGKIFYEPDNIFISKKFLSLNQENYLREFSLIDNKNYWFEDKKKYSQERLFEKYKIIKTFIREKIILNINKNFKDNFYVYGEDKKNIGINFLESEYNNKKVNHLYEGNICLDTGSILGSLSLHPRSIQILESNGLLIQTKQKDSEKVWGNLEEKIIYNNIDDLLGGIELMLTNQKYFNECLDLIYEKFSNSEYKNYETVSKAFKF